MTITTDQLTALEAAFEKATRQALVVDGVTSFGSREISGSIYTMPPIDSENTVLLGALLINDARFFVLAHNLMPALLAAAKERANMDRTIARDGDRIKELLNEIASLKAVIGKCASAIGNGAYISPECSLEFMSMLPAEIQSAVAGLKADRAAAEEVTRKALEAIPLAMDEAARKEREACAKSAEDGGRNSDWVSGSLYEAIRGEVAAAIRARGTEAANE